MKHPPDICPGCKRPLPKKRSVEHHRFFFAAVRAAFAQWPETHPLQPESPEHLRAWLLCEVGKRSHIDVPTDSPDMMADIVMQILHQVRREDRFVFPRVGKDRLRLYFPDSIAWSRMTQKEFSPTAGEIFDVIESVVGIKVDDLVRKTEELGGLSEP